MPPLSRDMMNFLKRNCCDGIYTSSIDIRFTKLCDNACDFCIEDNHGVGSFGRTRVDRMVDSVRSGVENEGKDTVLILGGEPFLLVKDLVRFVSQIRDMVKKIYITTSVPGTLDYQDKRIRFIMNNIDGLNVSVHHWDWQKNNEVLKARNKFNRFEKLEELGWYFGHKMRLQCNLVKGAIENRSDILRMVKLAERMYIDEIKFNELQDVGEDLYVSFDELFPLLELPNPYSRGCVNKIDCFKTLVDVTVKRACFMVQDNSPHGASLLDVLKVVLKKFKRRKSTGANVIYENGLRSSGWIAKEIPTRKI